MSSPTGRLPILPSSPVPTKDASGRPPSPLPRPPKPQEPLLEPNQACKISVGVCAPRDINARVTTMRVFATAFCLLALGAGAALVGQELGLREYLRRLDSAPGLTMEQKIEHLRSQGVTLSDWGLNELRMASGSALRYQDNQAQTSRSFTSSARPFGGSSWLESYTVNQGWWGRYRIENDLDPLESYTIRPRALGGYRIESDLDPMKSFTMRPRLGGGYRIESDLDPTKTYTVRPRLGGGYRIENDLDPLESYTVRPRLGGGYRIESDFPGRRR